MTGTSLAQMLETPGQAGVYFVLDEDIALLDIACGGAGLHTLRIDLQGCDGRAPLLQRLAEGLATPAAQGCNWDALSDQLRDLSWLPANGYALLFGDAGDLRQASPADFDTLLDILAEAAASWAGDNVPFWAFFELPGGGGAGDPGDA